jgi:hypothetical protein
MVKREAKFMEKYGTESIDDEEGEEDEQDEF